MHALGSLSSITDPTRSFGQTPGRSILPPPPAPGRGRQPGLEALAGGGALEGFHVGFSRLHGLPPPAGVISSLFD